MNDIVLFDHIVIRIKQLIVTGSGLFFILANHFEWLAYLHFNKVWTDRIEFLIIVTVALNRPAGYMDSTSNIDKSIANKNQAGV